MDDHSSVGIGWFRVALIVGMESNGTSAFLLRRFLLLLLLFLTLLCVLVRAVGSCHKKSLSCLVHVEFTGAVQGNIFTLILGDILAHQRVCHCRLLIRCIFGGAQCASNCIGR